jgi:hypothetical protein
MIILSVLLGVLWGGYSIYLAYLADIEKTNIFKELTIQTWPIYASAITLWMLHLDKIPQTFIIGLTMTVVYGILTLLIIFRLLKEFNIPRSKK